MDRENCLHRYLRRGSTDKWHMFIALVLLALENLFPIGMDDQLEIWKRKTWIVTERSWGRICILQPGTFFAGETGYFVALPIQIGSFTR